MSIVKINKDIIPKNVNINDISEYVQKRLNKYYCFNDIIRYDEMDSDCDDINFLGYIDMKTSLVLNYIHYSSKDYLSGTLIRCDCTDDDTCNCTFDVDKINFYIFACLCSYFDISDLVEMEDGLRRYLSLRRCAKGIFDIDLKTSDCFESYMFIKQKLVDKFLGIEGDDYER